MPTGDPPELCMCGESWFPHSRHTHRAYTVGLAQPVSSFPVPLTARSPRISDEDIERIAKRVAEIIKAGE